MVPTVIFMPFTSQFTKGDVVSDFTWAAILRSIQVVLDMSIFTSAFLLINNSCNSLERGAVNGLAMTVASFTKATGPILGSVIFAWSVTNGLSFPLSHHFGFFIVALLYFVQSMIVLKYFPQELNVMKGGEGGTNKLVVISGDDDKDEIDTSLVDVEEKKEMELQ